MHKGISRAVRRGGVLALVLGGGALAMPSLALANPACGKVVTSNVKLNSNMVCTSGNDPTNVALYVGKNGITINLNGFTISSDRSIGTGIDNVGDWGPSAPGSGGGSGPGTGFNNVTVENGNITGFNFEGIYAGDLTAMKISSMNVNSNQEGLFLFDSNMSSITGSHFNHNTDAGADLGGVGSGQGNLATTISNTTFNSNDEEGLDDYNSQSTLNGVKANKNLSYGVLINAPVAPYLVENSKANGNLNIGTGTATGDGFQVLNNEFNTVTFKNNAAENNSGWGFWAESHSKGGNNDYENDGSGGCHNVGGCFLSP